MKEDLYKLLISDFRGHAKQINENHFFKVQLNREEAEQYLKRECLYVIRDVLDTLQNNGEIQ